MSLRLFFMGFHYLIFFSSCGEQEKQMSDFEASQYNNKEWFHDVNIRYSDSAEIQIQIIAPEMIRYTEESQLKEEFPKGFLAYFFDEHRHLNNTLASKYAIRVHSEGKTYMRDSVVFTSTQQEVLKTTELVWNEINGRLTTDKFVRIIRKDEILQGYGFETDQNFRMGTIKSIDAIIPSEKLFKEE